MSKRQDPIENFKRTKKDIGYVQRIKAKPGVYKSLGFKSGLEVHQQLKTKEKLFCRCPAASYQDFDDYDAEIIRHMRPTLSELGEYDGTALMEFKTKKEITYRLKNHNACTYDIDDTPPFPMNREALEYAIEIASLLNLNIIGELHIARKQYLDGSIPTGFQRTGIIGIEGSIPVGKKKIGIIQLSIEEDSCREVSDIGHSRIYCTDRLGTPLIETVTYPHMLTPDEVKEVAHYIRFLARSTNKVRTGIGAGREDVNVSITGGTRVEIKGVAKIALIPELTHNEAFRQSALLNIKSILLKRKLKKNKFKLSFKEISSEKLNLNLTELNKYADNSYKLIAINIPGFLGILSHFTQPGQSFINEISDRLKVVACLEKPNMFTSEDLDQKLSSEQLELIKKTLDSKEEDSQILIWTNEFDKKTAIETIEERCLMAYEGVPNETRKALPDGTTLFERVLPGADRMYPDTDTVPIRIEDSLISKCQKNLPVEISKRLKQLEDWSVPIDTYHYILRNNLIPLMETMIDDLGFPSKFVATTLAHRVKNLEGRWANRKFNAFKKVLKLFEFVHSKGLHFEIVNDMLPVIYENPRMDFDSVLITIDQRKVEIEKLLKEVPPLQDMFKKINRSKKENSETEWIMGRLRKKAIGNFPLHSLHQKITNDFNSSSVRG